MVYTLRNMARAGLPTVGHCQIKGVYVGSGYQGIDESAWPAEFMRLG